MRIVNHELPTEGVKIAGIHFKPGEEKEVNKELAEQLVKRKGFKSNPPAPLDRGVNAPLDRGVNAPLDRGVNAPLGRGVKSKGGNP